MKPLLAAWLFSAAAALAGEEAPLPAWEAEDRAKAVEEGWMAGWFLAELEPPPDEATVEPLPPGTGEPTPDELAEAPEGETEVGETYLDGYFAAKPAEYLLDPQGLFTPEEAKELGEFLTLHSADSSIDLFVYVFGGNQSIPTDVRDEEVAERLFSEGKPAALIYHFVGSPQRTVMHLSPAIADSVSAAEQRRALESSVIRAFARDVPAEQLREFLRQMSVRLYWMERMTKGTAAETMESIPESEDVRIVPESKPARAPKVELPPWMKGVAVKAAVGLGCLLALVLGVIGWRGRVRFRFPEFEVEPRLGGSHAAGIGAVISFGSPAIPPAMQRKQTPDYVRRA